VTHAVEIARGRPDVHFVESRPGYDSPDLHRLLAALESGGLRRVSEAHVYSAPASMCARDRAESPGLDMERVESVDDDTLALYERTRAVTLDRADAQRLEPLGAVRVELRRQAPQGPTWVARFDRNVVGFLWASVDHEDREAWILDVGVDPDHRRRGIARALLSGALAYFLQAGMTKVAGAHRRQEPAIDRTARAGRLDALGGALLDLQACAVAPPPNITVQRSHSARPNGLQSASAR
jgi:ribosomal protein S18 acetylase RimI-like enzyme